MAAWLVLSWLGPPAGAEESLEASPAAKTGSGPSPDLSPAALEAFFDAALAAQIQEHQIVGAVVSVVHQGQVAFKRGYGWADLETRVPADPDRSLFRIASISKPFIWTAVMQQVERGNLGLDDDVNQHLSAFQLPARYPEPIRIRHLLTHTPGLEDRAIGMHARSLDTLRPLATYLAEDMPARVRPPGEHASYSNWGTALAAHVVENVSGQSWADYVDEHVLRPLAMGSTNTHTELSADFAARMAKSYTFESGRFVAQAYEHINDAPAGAISTTADDMTRFMIAHLDLGAYEGKRILSEATARQMQTPLFDPHPGLPPMLHGFYRADRNGQVIFGHGGDTNQFHSQLSLFPEHDLGVFVSFNSDPADLARSNLIRAFTDHFFSVGYLRPAPEPVAVDLGDYVGEYIPLRSNQSSIERLGILVSGSTITESDGELVLNGTSRWVPLGDDRFAGRYADRLMVFEREAGAVTHVLIGEPLNTLGRVRGLDAPGNARNLIVCMLGIALVAVLGYGYRALWRAPKAGRLPIWNVLAGWLHALLLLGLYADLAVTLSGDVEEFVFGVPRGAHINLTLLAFNSLLGLYVAGAAVRHWTSSSGAVAARIRYSALALAALANLWVAWYFNILTYPLS